VGALYVRSGLKVSPILDGGGHEGGMRSGTLNVPGIVGFGKACEIAQQELPSESSRIAGLRNRLRDRLLAGLDGISINGSMEQRLPGNLNVSFRYVDGETLMTAIREMAVSSGAACNSDNIEHSHVLKAMGLSDEQAGSAIRFGVGRFNDEEEIDYIAARVIEAVKGLRQLSPEYEAQRAAV
jgi:cysteine desulfurase